MRRKFAMKRTLIAILCISVTTLAGCGAKQQEEMQAVSSVQPTKSAEAPFLIKLASDALPGGIDYDAIQLFKDELETASNGSMEVQLYQGGQLGTQSAVLEGMQSGNLEMAWVPDYALTSLVPEVEELEAALMIADTDKLKDNAAAEQFRNKTGIRIVTGAKGGKRYIWTHNTVRSLSDLNGMRLCVQDSSDSLAYFQLLGVQSNRMQDSQIYEGLKANLIDGAELDTAAAMQFRIYELCHNCLKSSHGITVSALCISDTVYERMTQEQRSIMENAASDAARYYREKVEEVEADAAEQLTGFGVVFADPDEQMIAE